MVSTKSGMLEGISCKRGGVKRMRGDAREGGKTSEKKWVKRRGEDITMGREKERGGESMTME